MPNDYKRQDLTEREKAILIFGIVTDCHDWKKLYILSREQPLKTTSAGNIATAASRWKYQSKVKKFVEEQTALFKAKADAIRNEANAAGNDGGTDPDQETQTDGETKTKKAKEEKRLNIDFTNLDSQLKYLSDKADQVITDDRQRFEIIKLIADIQKRTATEDGPQTDIQRFYTPVACRDCVLYREARQSDENGPK